jgi:hypothetical protein
VKRIWSALRSAALARAVLLYLAVYSGVAAWLPWARSGAGAPPAWAAAVGLDHPFSSLPFLAGAALLFLSTLACTWGRERRILALWRGQVPAAALALEAGSGPDAAAFLRAQGFRGPGPVLHRYRFALWGGWVLHVGLLVLIAGVIVQQALHDGGAFQLTEGEAARLAAPGVVFQRERGRFAPALPPDLEVALESFDPYLDQPGYAPDRLSRVTARQGEGTWRSATVDRASGFEVGAVTIYQAIPSGLSLNVEVPGLGVRSLHLRSIGEREAAAEATDPSGRPVRFTLRAENPLEDRRGTGPVQLRLDAPAGAVVLSPGQPFPFGGAEARIASIGRWSGFTYARSPGLPAVFAGFAVILLGCLLLTFPAGVAVLGSPGASDAARVHLVRGGEALRAEWEAAGGGPGAARVIARTAAPAAGSPRRRAAGG